MLAINLLSASYQLGNNYRDLIVPTIVFAQSKGGAGKTTAAIAVASQLALSGASVTLIDADPNGHAAKWARRPGCPDGLTVVDGATEATIVDMIDDAAERTAFVIVDLEGTASMTVGYAISRADLVLVPCQGSQDDADEAARTVGLLKQQEKAFRMSLDYAILLSRVPAALQPRTLKAVMKDFEQAGVPILRQRLVEREAYRAVRSYGGTLSDLTADEVSGAEKAQRDVVELTEEIITRLRRAGE